VTPAQRTRLAVVALALLSATGAVLAHYAVAFGHAPTLGAVLALAPAAALAALAVRRAKRRAPLLLALAAAAALLWAGWDALERQFPDIFFLEHVGTNLLLGAMFGRTLAGGSEPLCTRFARLLHGPLSPEEERYSRQVTIAWTLFFLGLAALSAALYLGGRLAAWSTLANLLTLPLVATLFAVEYAVRGRVLPGKQRAGILDGLRAFWRHSSPPPSGARR
jgi:uncharacterized membrane protein